MEALLPVFVGVAACASAWILVGPQEGSASVEGVRASLAREAAVARLALVGSLAPVDALGQAGPVREAARAVEASAPGRELRLGPEAARGVLAVAATLFVLLGTVLSGPVGAVVCGAALAAAVPAWAASVRRRRAGELARQVPGMFRSLAVALGAGRTLSQAISYVGSRGTDALSREFGRASLRVSCGVAAGEALAELADRTRAPGIDLMVCALLVSARTGAPLQGLFLRSARLAELRFELERELMGKTAQIRLSTRIVSALPAGLVAVLALISADFRAGLGTPVGAGCVAVAALLDLVALLVIRRLMRGVL